MVWRHASAGAHLHERSGWGTFGPRVSGGMSQSYFWQEVPLHDDFESERRRPSDCQPYLRRLNKLCMRFLIRIQSALLEIVMLDRLGVCSAAAAARFSSEFTQPHAPRIKVVGKTPWLLDAQMSSGIAATKLRVKSLAEKSREQSMRPAIRS